MAMEARFRELLNRIIDMPPKTKFDPNDPATAQLISNFQAIGLDSTRAIEAARNPKTAASLNDLITTNDITSRSTDGKKAGLIASVAGASATLGSGERSYLVNAILDDRLRTTDQTSAAIKYLTSHPISELNQTDFDRECGVGLTVTAQEVAKFVSDFVYTNAIAGWESIGSVLGSVKNSPEMRWAATLDVKNAVEKTFVDTFGPKIAVSKSKELKKAPAVAGPPTVKAAEAPSIRSVFEEGFLGHLHKPGDNPQIDPRHRKEHLAATHGEVWTRFPPEPNGFLHIGHSKAIFVNFGYAAHYGGKCYLRFDDTNPEAEEARFFESILETIRWLGFEPWKITYSSDYFDELYYLAVKMIKDGYGYICHCTAQEINAGRGGPEKGPRSACRHRERPAAESLEEFEKMKNGLYKPGEAILRMKQKLLEEGNPQMWDLIAYRVLNAPHHRTGDKWKIYPTYDFTHCLVDSMENISHSLCTTEFISSRVSYEWLCDILDVYKPRQSEYGRLNITGTIMSKRKILWLVKEGHVMDWDDPRLFTLVALRRRGVPPQAIVNFVGSLGVSTSTSNIQVVRLEQTVRQYLENDVPRLLMVLYPLRVLIENMEEDEVIMLDNKPLHPKIQDLGARSIPFTRNIFIDQDDFRTVDSEDYFRLAPGKTVGLFQAPYPITCVSFETDDSGKPTRLLCRLEKGTAVKKPKAYIQWVAEHSASGSPVRIDQVRIFHPLFKSENPLAALPDWKADLAQNSLETITGGLVEVGFWTVARLACSAARKEGQERTKRALQNLESASHTARQEFATPVPEATQLVGNDCVRFQGLRVAYFALDKDARVACLDESLPAGRQVADRIILNHIVSLKEDSGKSV